MNKRVEHWQEVYKNKDLQEVSWYQEKPETSIALIQKANLDKSAAIIDVGGGNSRLVDYLLNLGYTNLSVLDISEAALKNAQKRLGEKAKQVNWILADVTDFKSDAKFDCWHDRATFHFLTNQEDIEKYRSLCNASIKPNGQLIVGAFSKKGPTKCSGLPTANYSADGLSSIFEPEFRAVDCFTKDHLTPSNKVQNFQFCVFLKE